jgi:hypothetical protein
VVYPLQPWRHLICELLFWFISLIYSQQTCFNVTSLCAFLYDHIWCKSWPPLNVNVFKISFKTMSLNIASQIYLSLVPQFSSLNSEFVEFTLRAKQFSFALPLGSPGSHLSEATDCIFYLFLKKRISLHCLTPDSSIASAVSKITLTSIIGPRSPKKGGVHTSS